MHHHQQAKMSTKKRNSFPCHKENEELQPRKRQKTIKNDGNVNKKKAEKKSKGGKLSKKQEEREIIRFIEDIEDMPWELRWKAPSILNKDNNSNGDHSNTNHVSGGGFEILSVETYNVNDFNMMNSLTMSNANRNSDCNSLSKKKLPKNPKLPNRHAWKNNKRKTTCSKLNKDDNNTIVNNGKQIQPDDQTISNKNGSKNKDKDNQNSSNINKLKLKPKSESKSSQQNKSDFEENDNQFVKSNDKNKNKNEKMKKKPKQKQKQQQATSKSTN